MQQNYLPFELPIQELDIKLDKLKLLVNDPDMNITSEHLSELEKKIETLTESIFSKLSPWQISQIARHPSRPYTLDYIKHMTTDFQELHGDRSYADDKAIIGGLAKIDQYSVMIIGHQKGRDTKEKIYRNFGMPRPEGYRKALRLMKMAERFGLPIITFIDTPGAYPGIGAEERGQSEAIATNLLEMSKLKVPVICTVIGEGGSGGALAIGVGDKVMMLEYSTYSVISPEGCASILWKSAEKASEAAIAMGITSEKIKTLGLIDDIVTEPKGGAHRHHEEMAQNLKASILKQLQELNTLSSEERQTKRYEKFINFGQFKQQ